MGKFMGANGLGLFLGAELKNIKALGGALSLIVMI